MSLWRWLTYPFRREQRRPLAYRQPQQPQGPVSETPLGLEAIDMSVVDAVNRRNAALERVTGAPGKNRPLSGILKIAETPVVTLKDDETYAARYHRAYNQKKGHSK